MEFQIDGKVFVITGAASGIGAVTANAFLEAGAKHVAVIDVADDAGLNLETELNQKHGAGRMKFFKCDVTNEYQFSEVFSKLNEKHYFVDAVINNAGMMNDNINVFRKMIDVNVTAVIAGTLKAIEIMRKDMGGRGGTVINISSVAALYQNDLMPIYYATKSAILQFTNCIGKDANFNRTGVRCITICFGPTDTKIFDVSQNLGLDEEMSKSITEAISTVKKQKLQSAAESVVEAYRKGASGSTWLSYNDKKPQDITQDIKDGHATFSRHYVN